MALTDEQLDKLKREIQAGMAIAQRHALAAPKDHNGHIDFAWERGRFHAFRDTLELIGRLEHTTEDAR